MRSNSIISGGCILFVFLLFTGCRKEHVSWPNHCRLLGYVWENNISEFFHYNSDGLADHWRANNSGGNPFTASATMEYNDRKILSKAKFFESDTSYFDIAFEYRNGKIVKETWYKGGTNSVAKVFTNIYDERGLMVRRDDPDEGYYVIFQYDSFGNNIVNEVWGTDGRIIVRIEYTFTKPVRNALTAIPGVPYGFYWTNQVFSKLQETATDLYLPDENGNLTKIFDRDPNKTILIINAHDYPVFQNHYDQINNTWDEQNWEYENCDDCAFQPFARNPSHLKAGGVKKSVILRGLIPHQSLKQLKAELKALK